MEGYQLNMPLVTEMIGANQGVLPDTFSLVSCDQENIVVETIKKAEDDDSVIVRLYETYNQKAEATIKTAFDCKVVYICDMMEANQTRLECVDGCVKLPVKNFEIVTLKFVR